MKRADIFKQIIKFTIIGCSGLIINLVLLHSWVEVFGFHYFFGAALAYMVAISSNFFWNKLWTFKSKSKRYWKQYKSYVFINLTSLAISLAALSILVEIFGVWYLFSQMIAVLIAGTNNFVFNKKITFKK